VFARVRARGTAAIKSASSTTAENYLGFLSHRQLCTEAVAKRWFSNRAVAEAEQLIRFNGATRVALDWRKGAGRQYEQGQPVWKRSSAVLGRMTQVNAGVFVMRMCYAKRDRDRREVALS
jgi:hypothetical protein